MRMDDAKPIASLSPGLLARKGGAKPAMRSQYQAAAWDEAAEKFADLADDALGPLPDDLGWNDMGEEAPAPKRRGHGKVLHMPTVVRQREALAAAPVDITGGLVRRSAFEQGRRAAFTLRVDAERHLRLRMACAVQNRSAQQLVTEALDRILSEVAGLEDLARRARRN